jgi:aldehyde:ferredoxin oxidoreductase
MLEVYNTIAEVRELFEEAEYIAEELWRQTVAGQAEFIEDIVERVAYLEDIYSFLEGNKSEDEEDIDGDNLIESHQGQVIEILQDNLAVLIKQVHRFEMGSRAHIEKIVSLWQHLIRNKRNSAMTQKILKTILETYLKLNPQDIPSFRERFSQDKQMQSFIDRLKESIQKKGTR